jgi:hypothetical protein
LSANGKIVPAVRMAVSGRLLTDYGCKLPVFAGHGLSEWTLGGMARGGDSIAQTGHFGVHLRCDLSGVGVGHRVRL